MGSDADKLGPILSKTSGHLTVKKMIVPTNLSIAGKTSDEIDALHEYHDNDRVNQIRSIVDSEQFAMFFVWKGDIYGAGDNSRVIYANMINPSPDMMKYKHFFAANLNGLFHGKTYQRIFDKASLDDIQIVSKEYVLKKLINARE